MLRFVDAANILSLCGLLLALAAAILASKESLGLALVALIGAGLCDLFDGFVARRMARDDLGKTFGKRLDSVVDACAFGLAPAVLLYHAAMRSWPELAALGLFACSAVWRLAYFDTMGLETVEADRRGTSPRPVQRATKAATSYYRGLPTTFVALVLPVGLLAGFIGRLPLRIAANMCALGLAAAMVSPIRIRKPSGIWYPILLLAAVCVGAVYVAGRAHYPAP